MILFLLFLCFKVKIWFQNKRSKYKKTGKSNSASPSIKNQNKSANDENEIKKHDNEKKLSTNNNSYSATDNEDSSNDSSSSSSLSTTRSISPKLENNDESYLLANKKHTPISHNDNTIFNNQDQQYHNYQPPPPPPPYPQHQHYQYQRNFIQAGGSNSPQQTVIRNDSELLLSKFVTNNEKFLFNSVFSQANYNYQQNPNSFNNSQNTAAAAYMHMMANNTSALADQTSFATNNVSNQNWIFSTANNHSSTTVPSSYNNPHSIHQQMIIPVMQ